MIRTKITMATGTVHWAGEHADNVARDIHEAQKADVSMIRLENTSTPSQGFFIDPRAVESIEPDPYG